MHGILFSRALESEQSAVRNALTSIQRALSFTVQLFLFSRLFTPRLCLHAFLPSIARTPIIATFYAYETEKQNRK